MFFCDIITGLLMPQIHLLCGDWNSDHCGKSKHKDKAFDSVIVSSASAHLLDGTSGHALVRLTSCCC